MLSNNEKQDHNCKTVKLLNFIKNDKVKDMRLCYYKYKLWLSQEREHLAIF